MLAKKNGNDILTLKYIKWVTKNGPTLWVVSKIEPILAHSRFLGDSFNGCRWIHGVSFPSVHWLLPHGEITIFHINPCIIHVNPWKKTMFHVSPHSSPCLMFESHLNPHVSLGNNHSQDITATPRAPKKRTLASHFRHGPAIWLWSPANCRKLPSGGLTEMWKIIGSTRNDLWMVILPHLQLAKLACRLTTIHLIVYSWVHESTYITQASVVVPQNEDLKNRCRGPTLLDNEPTGRRISIACGDWGLTQAAFFSVFLRKHFLEIRPWVNILKMANL